ncbi:MAG: tripartite tricarboxylate transporter TctB family protein, partial [Deltaproteobacteria bacterium]|nr:tripartite tricarboxylate transporter TctB family protein [Deltaproteobacteria bacterium]
LWAQRDYMTRFGGIFPDIVLEIMAGVLVVTLVLSFTPYAAMKEEGEKKKEVGKTNWTDMAVVGGTLFAWAVLLQYLGFALTGIVGFGGISWYLGGMRRDVKDAGRCLLIGVAIVILMVVVFQRLLEVQLPPGRLFD